MMIVLGIVLKNVNGIVGDSFVCRALYEDCLDLLAWLGDGESNFYKSNNVIALNLNTRTCGNDLGACIGSH